MEQVEYPIDILASKVFSSGGQLTKARIGGVTVYIRENVKDGKQVLELIAPDHAWLMASAIIKLEDHLGREVVQNPDFKAEWAEAHLSA